MLDALLAIATGASRGAVEVKEARVEEEKEKRKAREALLKERFKQITDINLERAKTVHKTASDDFRKRDELASKLLSVEGDARTYLYYKEGLGLSEEQAEAAVKQAQANNWSISSEDIYGYRGKAPNFEFTLPAVSEMKDYGEGEWQAAYQQAATYMPKQEERTPIKAPFAMSLESIKTGKPTEKEKNFNFYASQFEELYGYPPEEAKRKALEAVTGVGVSQEGLAVSKLNAIVSDAGGSNESARLARERARRSQELSVDKVRENTATLFESLGTQTEVGRKYDSLNDDSQLAFQDSVNSTLTYLTKAGVADENTARRIAIDLHSEGITGKGTKIPILGGGKIYDPSIVPFDAAQLTNLFVEGNYPSDAFDFYMKIKQEFKESDIPPPAEIRTETTVDAGTPQAEVPVEVETTPYATEANISALIAKAKKEGKRLDRLKAIQILNDQYNKTQGQ